MQKEKKSEVVQIDGKWYEEILIVFYKLKKNWAEKVMKQIYP